MTTAMARPMPCKQATGSPAQRQQQQQPRYSAVDGPGFARSRGYWEMQQPVQSHPVYIRSQQRRHAEHVENNHHREKKKESERRKDTA